MPVTLQHRARTLFPRLTLYALLCAAAIVASCASARTAQTAASRTYVAYVANEASDIVSRVVFDPATASISQREIAIGERGRIAGAHGIAAARDGKSWYVVLAHGVNGGHVAKYASASDTLIARVQVGAFPEDIAVTPDGQYLYVANHDLHGTTDDISGISIIFAATMTEVARPNTCGRPRGGVFNQDGSSYYSLCSGSDQLVEIDTRSFHVIHRFSLTPGRETTIDSRSRGGRGALQACDGEAIASGSTTRNVLFVLCNATNEVVQIDASTWRVIRRTKVPASAAGIAVDATGGLLLVAVQRDSAVLAIDATSGTTRARMQTTQNVPHGIAIAGDGRYAFVTNEGAGSARGSLDVFDVSTLRRVASITLAYGPGSIDVLTQH